MVVARCRSRAAQPGGDAREVSAPVSAKPRAIPAASAPGPTAEREGLQGPAEQTLEVPGFEAAAIVVPVGATSPRPVVIALHGNFDRPEWQCDVWKGIVARRCFVLCPRGIRRTDVRDRYTYGSAAQVKSEITAVLKAARHRFLDRIDVTEPVLSGFSLGAIHAARLMTEGNPPIRRAALVEGGYKTLSKARLRQFAAQGGRRLLLGCGQSVCRNAGRRLIREAGEWGLEVRVANGGDAGHTYAGAVAAALTRDFSWLLGADARFDAAAGP